MSLLQQQTTFANYLRDPVQHSAPPDIEERRLKIYRELFFNNINALLRANFPVIHSVLDETEWTTLVRDFYREHSSHTPLFPEVAKEFLRYLETRPQGGHTDPPWLLELAHYEWVELALDLDDNVIDTNRIDPHGDLLAGVPLPSPQAWPLAYRFAVHRIAAGRVPSHAPDNPTFLLVLRDHELHVRFKEVSAALYVLLQTLIANIENLDTARSGHQLLLALAQANGIHDPKQQAAFIADGTTMLQQLRDADVLLGTRRLD